jgi:hypothetical protein
MVSNMSPNPRSIRPSQTWVQCFGPARYANMCKLGSPVKLLLTFATPFTRTPCVAWSPNPRFTKCKPRRPIAR